MFLKLSSRIIELTRFLMLRLLPKLPRLLEHRAIWAGRGAGNNQSCVRAGSRRFLTVMLLGTYSFWRPICPWWKRPIRFEAFGTTLRGSAVRVCYFHWAALPATFRRLLAFLPGAAWLTGACSPLSRYPCCKHFDTKNCCVICVYSTTNILVFGHFKPGILGLNADGLQQ